MESVTLYGAGRETTVVDASDLSAELDTQRYEIWGKVAQIAAEEQAKYASSGAAEKDTRE